MLFSDAERGVAEVTDPEELGYFFKSENFTQVVIHIA